MILHRLRLTNFRGVGDRELRFPERGVVVVCGPNEIGKSSMLEALDLLLTYRDRSNHRDVKKVKPAHADVGAEVEAEISTGEYRFVYRKRFHKKHQTELEVIEPRRENKTGDEAHERVEAILAETLDTKLWDAQRVLQSASTQAVDLSGCDALSRALDAAAGEAVESASGTGADSVSLLIDRIEAEYLRYFTATGRPSKDFKAAIERLAEADREVQRCAAAVAEVNDRVRRHEELTSAIRILEERLAPANERVAAARQAQAVVSELKRELDQARLAATAAAATAAKSAAADEQRRKLAAEAQRRADALADLRAAAAVADQDESAARQTAEPAAAASNQAAAELDAAQKRFDAARVDVTACTVREEAEKLAARLRRIDETAEKLAGLDRQLSGISLTAEMLTDIEQAAGLIQRLQAQRDAQAATVEFTAVADLDITVDGQSRSLIAGQTWTQPASAAVSVDVPGVLAVRIDPGASTVKLHADLQAAQQVLQEALAAAGVADLAAARARNEHRRTLLADRAQAATTLELLGDGEDVEQLRTRLAGLHAAVSATPGSGADAQTAAAELRAADDALTALRAEAEAQRTAAAAAASILGEKVTQATLLRDRVRAAEGELASACGQLAAQREEAADDVVAAAAAADAEQQRQADAQVSVLAERYAAADPNGIAGELDAALDATAVITGDLEAAGRELLNLTAELGVIGGEGRQGQLDEAEAELDRSRSEHARLEERANAVKLLRETMIRHRDSARQRYVQPYRTELERLGRTVFGETFEVDIDTELTICSRTLDGRTVPFDSLSGGAREQLGILARLAGAALVSVEDSVPVVIDDALGFSDPERLQKMGAVFNTVGDRGQVIVLTCTPGRYAGVADAEVIELGA